MSKELPPVPSPSNEVMNPVVFRYKQLKTDQLAILNAARSERQRIQLLIHSYQKQIKELTEIIQSYAPDAGVQKEKS